MHLNREKSEADNKVSHPIDSDGDSSCHRPGPRIEKLRDEEPRDRAWTSGEKYDVDNDQNDAEVGQPASNVLLKKE